MTHARTRPTRHRKAPRLSPSSSARRRPTHPRAIPIIAARSPKPGKRPITPHTIDTMPRTQPAPGPAWRRGAPTGPGAGLGRWRHSGSAGKTGSRGLHAARHHPAQEQEEQQHDGGDREAERDARQHEIAIPFRDKGPEDPGIDAKAPEEAHGVGKNIGSDFASVGKLSLRIGHGELPLLSEILMKRRGRMPGSSQSSTTCDDRECTGACTDGEEEVENPKITREEA